MESVTKSSKISISEEPLYANYGVPDEDKVDIKYFIDNFNGATKLTYIKVDKSDPDDEKTFECVEFFEMSPEEFVKSGMINHVVNDIEKDTTIENGITTYSKDIMNKLSITMEEEVIGENILDNNNIQNIPKITITSEDKEFSFSDNDMNDNYNNNNVIEYATIIADKVCTNAFNFDETFVEEIILQKNGDIEETPLSPIVEESSGDEYYLGGSHRLNNDIDKKSLSNNYSSPPIETPTFYDYQEIVNNNNMTNKYNEDKMMINKSKEKSIKSSTVIRDQVRRNIIHDFDESSYDFDERYAAAILRQHESFHTPRESLSSEVSLNDGDKIKTVITLKNDGFSDILNVNHCVDCILERTLKANPFYHAEPERLSMRCSKCKPCERHLKEAILKETNIIPKEISFENHDCLCEDICREIDCSICENKIPLCQNLEHERNCADVSFCFKN
uniref:TNFR-Cys domain-containing protein n=1 Tax=Parastrongyloides trichosuri TaxID=131310 RepID=A0A0N4Z564_PARTI